MILKIHTDEGIVGLGEPTLEGREQTVAAAIQEIGAFLIGQDPRRIEHIWQAIYRGQFYRGGPVLCSALSGIEHALWDITGKWLGQPVYQLLGGAVRDSIRMYAWLNGETPEELAVSARERVGQGFTMLKMLVTAPVYLIEHTCAGRRERAPRGSGACGGGAGCAVRRGLPRAGRPSHVDPHGKGVGAL